ncbi:Sec-independent protein translocase subunit TatA [Arthrobacter sp. NPDC097144]|uniref:Sec-independent protein translocase subunit TatA n=1 Tax=Arthrobacter sp. NPDC097144 TaxID=3363946 RepID=UPI00382D503A
MKLEGWHFVIVIALALLLFGAPRLPGLARSAGQSLRIFRSEVRQMKDENPAPAPETPAPAAAAYAAPPAPAAPAAPDSVQKGQISGT